MERRRNRLAAIVVWFFLFLIGFTIILILSGWRGFAVTEKRKNLPRIEITLEDGLTLDEIHQNSKEVRYLGNDLVFKDADTDLYFSGVEIKGRGNYTWTDVKRPYRIKFQNKVDLLGLGKLRKWAFLTYNLDDSLLRGDLGFHIASMIDPSYPLRGEFAELSIDGEELGLYFISPTVTIDKRVVDVRNTDGILVELDNAYYGSSEFSCMVSENDHLAVKDVVNEDDVEKTFEKFCKTFQVLEVIAKEGNYEMLTKIADVDSLAEYVLFSEFIGNIDSYMTSFYFYRDGEEDLIHAGPAWDFDAAFGNNRWGSAGRNSEFYAPWTLMAREQEFLRKVKSGDLEAERGYSTLAYDLLKMPKFSGLVQEMYLSRLAGRKGEVVDYIKGRTQYIRDSATTNNRLWGNGDFDEAVDYLIWWVEQRFDVFDEIYGAGFRYPLASSEI